MDWYALLLPALTGAFAFFGAIVGNKTEIAWIKRELSRHDIELARLHSRISKGK